MVMPQQRLALLLHAFNTYTLLLGIVYHARRHIVRHRAQHSIIAIIINSH